jgi:hypothetical protein
MSPWGEVPSELAAAGAVGEAGAGVADSLAAVPSGRKTFVSPAGALPGLAGGVEATVSVSFTGLRASLVTGAGVTTEDVLWLLGRKAHSRMTTKRNAAPAQIQRLPRRFDSALGTGRTTGRTVEREVGAVFRTTAGRTPLAGLGLAGALAGGDGGVGRFAEAADADGGGDDLRFVSRRVATGGDGGFETAGATDDEDLEGPGAGARF